MSEIIACPECQRQLNVPESYFGQTVKCPDCHHEFKAAPAGEAVRESKTSNGPLPTPVKERARRRFDDDNDDDDDYNFHRRVRKAYQQPHRGSTILMLGILSIFVVPLVLGTLAWVMGNADLRAMEDGRMDPRGMSETRTGRTIGAVMVVLNLVIIAGLILFFVVLMASLPH
jgi:hypothetical protein